MGSGSVGWCRGFYGFLDPLGGALWTTVYSHSPREQVPTTASNYPNNVFSARQPVEQNAAAILQRRDHRRRTRVVFLFAYAIRRVSPKDSPAQVQRRHSNS
jgi:hypothetical protein